MNDLDLAVLDPNQFSSAWFEAALQRNWPGVAVRGSRLVSRRHGTCTKIRASLELEGKGSKSLPSSVVIKGGYETHSADFAPMHECEMLWYRDIAPRSPIGTPLCLYAGPDEAGNDIVVLEDLDARGVVWLHALRPLDFNAAEAFVRALAGFAASWWDHADLAEGGALSWIGDSFEGFAAAYIKRYTEQAKWDELTALPRGACAPRAMLDRARMIAALEAIADIHRSAPPTLAHGDVHLGNLYLDRTGRPGFLDAQVRRAPWVKDLAYFIAGALDIPDRRRWEAPLIEIYLSALKDAGAPVALSMEEAMAAYAKELPYGLFIFLINEGAFQSEAVNTANAARFAMAALDHQSLERLGV